MRFMVIIKANKDSEAGVLPDQELLAAMGNITRNSPMPAYCWRGRGSSQVPKGLVSGSLERNELLSMDLLASRKS